MGFFRRLILMMRMGGIDLPLFKIEDRLFKTNNAARFKYKIYEAADVADYPKLIALDYELGTGKTIDLEQPVTFNEKIQWLKAYDSTPLKTQLADKYLVRGWIKDKIGEEYLVPLLGVWDSFEQY